LTSLLFRINMIKFILGKKLGMSTIYDEKEGAQNATLVECLPTVITQIRTEEKDGYSAIQTGITHEKKNKKLKKKKEFKSDPKDMKVGDALDISQFEIGDKVKVSGITKAKGFQGVVKRHGFKGSMKSHGHKHDLRAPGSIGATYPEHVIKGKRMAGRMGGKRSSTLNLKIVEIDKENNILFLKGAVPGVKGRIVEITA
jgi:large subunit ribosomal protein L3